MIQNSSTKKILFIGRLSIDNTPCAGEVMKNRELCDRLATVNGHVKKFNVTKYHRRLYEPIIFIRICFYLFLCGYNIIVVSTYDELAIRIISILGFLRQIKKTQYWVIGGGISLKIENGLLTSQYYKNIGKIIVEDISIEEHLSKMGFDNVITLPNFKNIFNITKPKNKIVNRFVFVSRITPLKGCDIIISAVKELNKRGILFEVDFWGFIEKGYPFEEYIKQIPNIHYRGVMSLNTPHDYEALGEYTAMLFPTYYPNEGFPGIFIDAFMAGLPVITTDWRYNSHILQSHMHGWMIPIQDSNALAFTMERIISGYYNLTSMSEECMSYARYYDTLSVLSDEILYSLRLL